MSEIELKNVGKRYGEVTVLKDISLEMGDGEFVVLVGPSGCGKSTLLRMIAGLEEITDGEILIGDKVVNQLEPRERGCAMVFQNYALYPHMSVRENVGYALKVVGDVGLRGAGQQALRIDARGDEVLEQSLALGDAEGISFAGGAEQSNAIAALGDQRLGVDGEICVVRRAVSQDRSGRGAIDAANGQLGSWIHDFIPPASRRA